jgi:formylglycine-generating enzyme required for sulfatase activity
MVYLEGGTFTMGCANCNDDESPQHSVTLGSFSIGKYPVTNRQWEAIMGEIPPFTESYDYPICMVNWDEVMEFISRLNAMTGKKFRLPSEAEWEYAARGGAKSKGYVYSGSKKLNDVGWFKDNSGKEQRVDPFPAGKKKSNELGIYDMSGNIWEWCSDWYGAYSAVPQHDPSGAASGSFRVIRGGYWNSAKNDCRVTRRSYESPNMHSNVIGFRLALTVSEP